MHPLSVERRALENASAPTTVYRVETRDGTTHTFTRPVEERRYFDAQLEVRDDAADDGDHHFRGHGAVFGRKSDDLGGFREVINPGAFKRVLDQNPDVRFMVNHTGLPLARTKNKTLDLREDPRGLHYYARAADTTMARDLKVLVERGDIDQSSFAFSMGPDSREKWEESEDGQIVRTIIEVDGLFDVSAVTYPAYPQTDVSAVRATEGPVAEPPETETSSSTEEGERAQAPAPDDPGAEENTDTRQAPSWDELLEGARRDVKTARQQHIYPRRP